MLVFDAAQFDGILKKISEFSDALLSDVVGILLALLIAFFFCVWFNIYYLLYSVISKLSWCLAVNVFFNIILYFSFLSCDIQFIDIIWGYCFCR